MISPTRRTSVTGTRSAALAAVALTSLLTLTACDGGDKEAAPKVASLPSKAAPPAGDDNSSSSGGADKDAADKDPKSRPQERLDDTDARRESLRAAWETCLVRHGAKWNKDTLDNWDKVGPKGYKLRVAEDPIPQAAKNACTGRLPIFPTEETPSKNPNYRKDMLAEIKCMKDHGMKVHLKSDTSLFPNGLNWDIDPGFPGIPNQSSVEKSCELEAFSD